MSEQLDESFYKISIYQGRNLIGVDRDGLSDPYVKFHLFNKKVKTKRVNNDLNPKWNFTTTIHGKHLPHEAHFRMYVIDHDRFSKNDPMGFCIIDLFNLPEKRKWYDLYDEDSHNVVQDANGNISQIEVQITRLIPTSTNALSSSAPSLNMSSFGGSSSEYPVVPPLVPPPPTSKSFMTSHRDVVPSEVPPSHPVVLPSVPKKNTNSRAGLLSEITGFNKSTLGHVTCSHTTINKHNSDVSNDDIQVGLFAAITKRRMAIDGAKKK